MTTDEALEWLTRRSCVILLHEQRYVVVMPNKFLDVSHVQQTFTIECRGGFVISQSEKGDTFVDVVQAAQRCWRESISVIDAIADSAPSYNHDPVKITMKSDKEGFWDL